MRTILLLALSLTACGARTGLETYDTADHGDADAAVETDAGAPEADAGPDSGTPEYTIGDPCMCCVWDPAGSGYPNGDVYCMQGKVDILEGLMCRAFRGENAPEYVPYTKGCLLQNPWGAPL